MFTRYLVLLILAVMCPEAVIAQTSSPTGQLRGRIEDAVTRRPVAGGAGLGLAIARRVMERAGGQLQLDSTAPRSARFLVIF